jgi:hypothetical protein
VNDLKGRSRHNRTTEHVEGSRVHKSVVHTDKKERPPITLGVLLSVIPKNVTMASRFRLFDSTTLFARSLLVYLWLFKHLSRHSIRIHWIECLVDVGLLKFSYTFWIPSHMGITKGSVHVGMFWGAVGNILHHRYTVCKYMTFDLENMYA